MNLVDVTIIILLIGAVMRGLGEGLVHQLFSTVGFFSGLWLGALFIEPRVLDLAHTPTARMALTLASTLGIGLVFLFIGELIGIVIKRKLRPQDFLNKADNILGAVIACVAFLGLVWISATVVNSLPYPAAKIEVQQSKIVVILQDHLPAAPSIIANIGRLIAPNGFPDVFIGVEPAPAPTALPTPAALSAAVQKDHASVVKIEGEGCGGIVAGSGFVVGDGFVATNAHVVAGIAKPEVIDGNGTHHATTIWFDPNLDFAVLRTSDLAGTSLPFDTKNIDHDTPAGVLGYPGGGDFQADSAAILDKFTALGRNIYGQGRTTRDVYSVQATVIPGNSGGPLVDINGSVIGIVFATSTSYKNIGYALTLQPVLHEIGQAKATNQPVSTGSCAE
jgi:S1-C subfamily serine protease